MSTGQILGAGGGAALGAFLALPTGGVSVGMGALYGAQAGMMVGGLLDPPKGPTQSGPRLSDTAQQTSTYGATIPRVYGTIGVLGNVFWLENNRLKEVVKKKKSGGKGGGSSATVKTYTYYGTFAVGLCEGPIAGVRRIWVGPDLVYDAGAGDLESVIASNQASSKFSIYLGTADQQPDPRMQAEMGVANCPAYRGLAYVVIKDLLLTKYGNSIQGAPIKVEVVKQADIPGVTSLTLVSTGTNITGSGAAGASAICQPSSDALSTSFVYNDTAHWYTETIWQSGARAIKQVAAQGSFNGGTYSAALSGVCDVAPYALSEYNGQNVNVGGVVYSGLPYIPGSASLQDVYQDGDDLVLVRRITGVQLHNLKTGAQLNTSPQAFGVALSGGVVYYVDPVVPTTLYARSASDFSLVSSTPLTNGIVVNVNMTASIDAGVYWVWTGGGLRGWDIASGAVVSQKTVPDSLHSGNKRAIVRGGVIYLASTGATTPLAPAKVEAFRVTAIAPTEVSLSGIFSEECQLTGLLAPSDVEVSALTDSVIGYRIAQIGSVRASIEPLQGAFPFDAIQSGYKIKAVPRGQSPVATIDIGDLGIDEQLRQSREMDTQLPTKIVASYLDRARNYDVNEQFWERQTSGAVNTRSMELPIVLGASQALQVVERLGNLYWLERTDFGPFSLPPSFCSLEPADVITLHAGYADYELRLTTVNYQSDGVLECSGRLNSPSLYISNAGSDETPDVGVIPLSGASLAVLLDIPVVDETLQNAPGFVSAMTGYTTGWPGGVIYRSADAGQTWTDLQGFSSKGSFGTTRDPLAVNAGNLIQRGGSLVVELLSGAAESVTEAQMLNGLNIAAYGAPGRWEIIRYQNATLNADGSYTLDTFWRGDKGTEWATGLHLNGDLIVLLGDPDCAFIGMSQDSIGQPLTYRPITADASIDSAPDTAFTYAGVNLECLSPAHPAGARDGSANLTVTWQRRTRVGGAWRDNVDASLSETAEAYEVDVMSGSTVKRTLTSSTPTVNYSAANQVTDFGSAQSSITLRIYQLSSVVGRGYPLETTL